MDELYNSYGSLLIPAGTVLPFSMTASEFIRIVGCPSFGVSMKIEGETESPIYAGLEFRRGNEKGRFDRVEFRNATVAPVVIKFFYGLGEVKDSSLHIFDPLASAIIIRNADKVETIAATVAPTSSEDAELFVAANENTAYVDISVTADSPAVYVGGLAALSAGSGRLIKPGETGRFDTKAALYVRSSSSENPGLVSGRRFFF